MRSIALSTTTVVGFVDFILDHHVPPTTLIICSTRETFMEALQTELATIDQDSRSPNADSIQASYCAGHLLNRDPAISTIAASRTIDLAFTPTLPHLRAYLAASCPKAVSAATVRSHNSRWPTFAIWGLIELHRTTTEHSAQGISHSMAAAVEAAVRSSQRFVVGELSKAIGAVDPTTALDVKAAEIWREQIPLLSGSVSFTLEGNAWTGKTIETGRVVGRWCQFAK